MCGLVIAVVLMFSFPGTAYAHARLKSATPGSNAHLAAVPRALRLDFTESPELAFSSVRLIGPDGAAVMLAPIGYAADSRRAIIAAVTGPMGAGSYTVMWQIAGDDGHPIRGRFTFVVAPGATGIGAIAGQGPAGSADRQHHDPLSLPTGESFGVESPAFVFARWLQFAGLLLVVGACTFRFDVLRLVRRDLFSAASAASAFVARTTDAARRAARIGFLAVVVLAISLVLRLGAQSYAMHGAAGAFDVGGAADMVRNTTWGVGWMVQFVGVLLAGLGYQRASVALNAGSTAQGDDPQFPRRGWWMLAAAGAALAALSPALSGHAASAPRFRSLAIVADWLHVLAASSWLGTLAVLPVAGLSAANGRGREDRGPFVRVMVNCFSPVALASAGLAMVTGVFAAWIHVGTFSNLWGSRYGITLLVKLAVLGIVALTGFYNWRVVQPRLGTDDATGRLRQSATVEVGVAVVVLLITAVLVASPTSMDVGM